jgi:PleD family two-component response regulator
MTKEDTHPIQVLIVDDTPSNLQLLANSIKDLNIDILYATNGYDAVSLAVKNKPELILLDIMMPGMDGYETTKKIRADRKTQDIPILFITAKSDDESIIKGFECGGQDYITKPFNPPELRSRVLTHLELRKAQKSLAEVNKNLSAEINQLRTAFTSLNQDLERFKELLEEYFSE